MQLIPLVNAYLNIHTNVCNSMASNPGWASASSVNLSDNSTPFLSAPNEICVLFMSWENAYHLQRLKGTPAFAVINNYNFLNQHVRGHAIFKHHRPYLGIYNFCRHYTQIEEAPPQQNQRSIMMRRASRGIGIEMFNTLLTSVTFLPSIFKSHITHLWLGIDVNNVEFKKVAKIYTTAGFSKPVITNRNIDGSSLGSMTIVKLTRPIMDYVTSQIDSLTNWHEVVILMDAWKGPSAALATLPPGTSEGDRNKVTNLAEAASRNILKCNFQLDRSCILSLHLFPYVNFDPATLAATGLGDYAGQRETAGRFSVIKSVMTDDKGYSVFSLNTVGTPGNAQIEYVTGEADHVFFGDKIDEATFHTHPILNYIRSNSIIGPPSSGDFHFCISVFLYFLLSDDVDCKSFKFSLVSTIEGLYIMSFKPAGIDRILGMVNQIPPDQRANKEAISVRILEELKVVTDEYEYNFAKRMYNWPSYDIDLPFNDSILEQQTQQYFEWFDEVNERHDTFFELTFTPWQDFDKPQTFDVMYLENRIKTA